jgi:hypothetical protein
MKLAVEWKAIEACHLGTLVFDAHVKFDTIVMVDDRVKKCFNPLAHTYR